MTSDFSVDMNEYLPLRDVVFNTLRQAILKGELKPGERLLEIALAERLGVSRTPVREAMRKLEQEGLVVMIPRRGAQVASITEKDLNDFIVGAAAKLDTPRKPRAEAREIDRRYFCGITDEMVSADRRALCAVDAALLKEQAAELGAAMANGVRVVFGSKDAVEVAKELFDTVETL